jgi:TonB family protein
MIRLASITIALATFAAHQPADAQTWTVRSQSDAFDDRPTVTAAVLGRGYSMAVRCKADLLEVVFAGGYIGDEDASVRYRFDGGEVHSDVWNTSTSRDALFADAPGEVARWIASGSRMVFEYEDFSGTPHQYSVSLNGSGVAAGRVLDACGVPRTNPRSQDSGIWRRAVIDLDRLEKGLVDDLQARLAEEGFEVGASGRRDLTTYRALSNFYSRYWAACRAGEPMGASCNSWRGSLRYDADADYPKEPVDLLVEVVREHAVAAVAPIEADTPPGRSIIINPSWSRAPAPDFPERAASQGILEGNVALSCNADASGSLSGCTINQEEPAGAGFGQAALAATRRARLSPRTVDAASPGSQVQWTMRFTATAPQPTP